MASNAQIRESLWGLGVPEELLRGINTNVSFSKFQQALQAKGVDTGKLSVAQRLADWRSDKDRTTPDQLTELLNLVGATPDQLREILAPSATGKSYTADELFANVTRVLGSQVATNLRIKMGQPPTTGEWNPFRADKPPVEPGGALRVVKGTDVSRARPGVRTPEVIRKPAEGEIGGLGGAVGGGGAGGLVNQALLAKPDLTIQDVDDIINQAYGFSAYALQIPEVKSILDQAAREDWDDERIKGAITSTRFWATTSDAERGWMALEKQDPATASRRQREQKENLRAQAQKLGFTVEERRLDQIADLSLRWGWSAAQANQALSSEFKFDPTGQKNALSRVMKQKAADYAIPLSDAAVQQWGQKIAGGQATEEEFDAYLTEQAKSMFPGLTVALDRGITVRQYVDPYVQIAADTLEITPEQINIADPKWLRAINQVDPKTGDRTAMTLTEWQDTLRQDPTYQWDKTKQARQQATQLSASVLKTFGVQ